MADLAIKGHAIRGKEVIEILEMLGGKMRTGFNLAGSDIVSGYYITEDGYIDWKHYSMFDNAKFFTLEEFLEKYPYKVGDKVLAGGQSCKILKMEWNIPNNEVHYTIENYKGIHTAEYLQPYKEETVEKRQYEELRIPLEDDDKLATEVTIDGNKIIPPENYLIGKITKVDNGMLVEFVKKQPNYPKTYKECCDVLGLNTMDNDAQGYKGNLIIRFQELLIARDAYWKIAGEQMGLKEPWNPDWNWREYKFCIGTIYDKIEKFLSGSQNTMLAFPTEEMRDVFYENFKDLIEECKELL